MTIEVTDTEPPQLEVALTPTIISTSDHRLVRVHAAIKVSDACGVAPPKVVLDSIKSNEPDSGAGPGDVANDIQQASSGTADADFLLRAESFSSMRNGRIYTITYIATDASGNQRKVSITVSVPRLNTKLP